MTRDCPTVDGWLNVQNFVEQELLRTGRRCFIVIEKGEIAGLVTPHEIKQIDRAKWPFTTLHDIMRPLEDMRSVSPDVSLISALELMSRETLTSFRWFPTVIWKECYHELRSSATYRRMQNCGHLHRNRSR